jgi:hypothetical protein
MYVFSDLINGQSLTSLAESVRGGFSSLAAQVQTTWFKQHDRHGAHKVVTATSLDSAGLVTFPRVGFRPDPFTYGTEGPRGIVVSPDIGGTTIAEAWHFANVEHAGVIIPDLSSGAATIYGLSVLHRKIGDVVALVNHAGYNTDLVLRLNPSGNFDGEFAGSLSTPNVDVTVTRGRWVWLMLLALPGSTALKWHVSHF